MSHTPSRRRFVLHLVSGGLLGAAGIGSAGDERTRAMHAIAQFRHGVASGDPLGDRVILWTRVSPAPLADAAIAVRWAVAVDEQMQQVVASGTVQADAASDYTVKVDAEGLLPGHRYFYQFHVEGADSPVGRTQTLPGPGAASVKMAVFSCANYPAGYFNVYADAAARDDLDVALHLGDYIYEYDSKGYACGKAEQLGRLSEPRNCLMTLDDYRTRYAQYRSDGDLQQLHARIPFITIWDDHEFSDDAWRDGAPDHDESRMPFAVRKAAAMQAYREWMPIRLPDPSRPERIYRSFDIGDLLSLHMLDTRIVGRDKQVAMGDFTARDGSFDEAGFRAAVGSPARSIVGAEQMAWLAGQVARSAARWQVVGQQILMGRMEQPAPVALDEVSFQEYETARELAQTLPQRLSADERAMLSGGTLPCYLDSWDGYAADRERLFGLMRAHSANLIVLSGDSHNAWGSDLRDAQGRAVGVEFATPSVSSPGLEACYSDVAAVDVAAMYAHAIPTVRYAQTSKRGYIVLTVTHQAARADWRFVDTVECRSFNGEDGGGARVLAGRRRIELV